MKELVKNFPAQLREAIEIGRKAELQKSTKKISNVLISGLGGSGIGGTIVSQVAASEANIPILVNKDYFIPHYVGEETLVIISSYSGNTEETLQAFDEALDRGAQIACITSGGKVREMVTEHGLNCIDIPGGFPPRAAFAYSCTQLFFMLAHYEVITYSAVEKLLDAATLLENEQENIIQEGLAITAQLHGKLPVLYSDAAYEGVSVRWRQQINENSKMLCWHHVFPEMNHNEYVGWTTENQDLAVVLLRNDNDYKRTQKRMEVCKGTFSKHTDTIVEVWSKGTGVIERSMYLIHLGDWISVQLAEAKGIDPVEVNVITALKNELATFE